MAIYEIDHDDPKALKNLAFKLLKRREKILKEKGYTGINFNGSKIHADTVMPLFEEIYNTNLGSIYDTDLNTEYYVYLHCDPTKPIHVKNDLKHLFLASKFNINRVPFYVGKGIGDRWKE